jgi:carbonic anhydrase
MILSTNGLEILIKSMTSVLLAALSDDKQRLLENFKTLHNVLINIANSLEINEQPQQDNLQVDDNTYMLKELENKLTDPNLSIEQKTIVLSKIFELKKYLNDIKRNDKE